MSDVKIKLENIYKSFGNNHVLKGVDLTIKSGESWVVIGGSGSGKSVILKTVLGLLRPDKGEVYIDGKPTVGISSKKRELINSKIGMLFQNAALFDSLSVWENIAFGLIEGQNMDIIKAKEIAINKLVSVGLKAEIANKDPADLSGGMRKRVALARAIADEPEIILFDEPTTGLDPIMGNLIDDLIVDCVKKLGATTLSITHDLASARRIATHIAMLYQGKIIYSGSVLDVDNSNNEYVKQFLAGSSKGPIQF